MLKLKKSTVHYKLFALSDAFKELIKLSKNYKKQLLSASICNSINSFIFFQSPPTGNAIADKLRAHFVTAADEDNGFKFASFAPFLKEVWDKKPEIEHAFHMEEPLTIDSGEGTMEHSMHHHHQPPQPPPRFESYLINGTYRHHNFDKMSHRSVNSLDGMEESVKYGNMSDDRQAYSNMYFYEENNSDADKDDRRMMGKGEWSGSGRVGEIACLDESFDRF